MQQQAGRVVIGMDPHKRSAAIEVLDGHENDLGGGRFDTSAAGFADEGLRQHHPARLRPSGVGG